MGDRSTIFLEDYISKRCLPGHRGRYFLGSKTGKRSEEDLYLQIAEIEFIIKVFLNQCSKKKEVRGLYLEETCNQAEENI